MPRKRAKSEPKMDFSPNPEVLRQQLMTLKTKNEILEAQLRSLKAQPKQYEDQLTLLERLAWHLALAAEVSQPLQSHTLDPFGRQLSDTTATPTPGVSTYAPRKHANRLKRVLEDALTRFEEAKEFDWYPPIPPKPPKVRCGKRDCSAYDVRVDAWSEVAGKKIYWEKCGSCGNPLPAPVDVPERPLTAVSY